MSRKEVRASEVDVPYSITTRTRAATESKPRGRKRVELQEDVVSAVQNGIAHRDEETVIGPFSDESEAKKLWGVIRARLRDGSFGEGLSARGGVAKSTDGLKFAVIFSITNRRAGSKRKAKAETAEGEPQAAESAEAPQELQPV